MAVLLLESEMLQKSIESEMLQKSISVHEPQK
jgi:hypothetical protein